jgi:hypothetical protein
MTRRNSHPCADNDPTATFEFVGPRVTNDTASRQATDCHCRDRYDLGDGEVEARRINAV